MDSENRKSHHFDSEDVLQSSVFTTMMRTTKKLNSTNDQTCIKTNQQKMMIPKIELLHLVNIIKTTKLMMK